MDDSGINAGNRHSNNLVAGHKGVLHFYTLLIGNLGHGLALFAADAPFGHQAGALHQLYGQVGHAQRSSMQHEHQHVLRVILVGQLALLDGSAETAAHVGVAGVSGVAVDVCCNAAFADQHINVAAARACECNEIALTLTQDLSYCSIGLTVGGKAAECQAIARLNKLCDGVVESVNLVHNKFLLIVPFLFFYKPAQRRQGRSPAAGRCKLKLDLSSLWDNAGGLIRS